LVTGLYLAGVLTFLQPTHPDLYEWNLRLGAALMRDIAHIEIAVRNAYDRAMRQHWQRR
jgi:hypothetical protein